MADLDNGGNAAGSIVSDSSAMLGMGMQLSPTSTSESANVKPNPHKRKKMSTHQKQYPGGSVKPSSNKRS